MRRFAIVCAIGVVGSVSTLRAQPADEDPVSAVEEMMRRWVQLEQQANTIKTSWRRQQPILEQRLVLLQKEREALGARLEQSKTTQSEVESKRLELLEEQTSLEREQQLLEQSLDRIVLGLEEIFGRLPPPMHDAWQDRVPRLRDESLGASERLQLVVDMLTEIEDFRDRVSLHEAVVEGDDGPYLVRQVYLGLSRGWYVNADESRAARGYSTPEGWVWRESDDAAAVARLIDIVEGREPAALLSLPIELAGGAASAGEDAR